MPDTFAHRYLRYIQARASALPPADARMYLVACVGFQMGAVVHAFWAWLFWYLDIVPLAAWDIGSALLWIVLSWTVVTGRLFYVAMVILVFVELPLRAALATYFTGISAGFWLYVIAPVVVIPLIPALTLWLRLLGGLVSIVTLVCIAALPLFVPPPVLLSPGWTLFFLATNIGSAAFLVLIVMLVFQDAVLRAETALAHEFDRAEGLLKNILPDPIALRLKDGEHLIADDHPDVSVIFADIANFTEASARLRPSELVDTLNRVFSAFDQLAARHGAEKIKTIGDAYMCVVGVPTPKGDHATIAVTLACDMLTTARTLSAETHFPIDLRIGINSGAVVAGVIGKNKFAYDLWGDAVNVAARMEAHGAPGKILITEGTATLLDARFDVTGEGAREVKGKGQMPVFSVAPA